MLSLIPENIQILVLGNKIDIPNSMGEVELKDYLGIRNICTGKELRKITGRRPLEVYFYFKLLFISTIW